MVWTIPYGGTKACGLRCNIQCISQHQSNLRTLVVNMNTKRLEFRTFQELCRKLSNMVRADKGRRILKIACVRFAVYPSSFAWPEWYHWDDFEVDQWLVIEILLPRSASIAYECSSKQAPKASSYSNRNIKFQFEINGFDVFSKSWYIFNCCII